MQREEAVKKLLRVGVVLLFFGCLAGIALMFWAWNSKIEVPAPIGAILKDRIQRETQASLSYESLILSGAAGEGTLSKAVLKNASSTVFMTVQEAKLHFSSGTSLVDFLSGETAIQTVEGRDIDIDLKSIRLPEKRTPLDELPGLIPVNQFLFRDIRIHTIVGTFTIAAAELNMRRVKGEMSGQIEVSQIPLGGAASISFRIPFDSGTGSVALDWTGASIPQTTALYPLLWFWGISIDDGTADLSLRWSGNVMERVSRPDSRIDALFRNELKGWINLRNLSLAWSGFQSRWNGVLESGAKAFGTWNCRIDGGFEREKISLEAVFDGSGDNWGVGASGTANISSGTWKLVGQFVPLPDVVEPGVASISFNARRPSGKSWQADISAGIRDFRIDSFPVETGQIDLQIAGGKVRGATTIDSSSGWCKAEGTYDIESGILDADASLDRVRSENVKYIPSNIKGLISGSFHLNGNPRRLADSTISGAAVIDNPGFAGRSADRLEGQFAYDRGAWSVTEPILRLANGEIAFRGRISESGLDGEIVGSDVPAEFLGIDPDDIRGVCSFRGDVTGGLSSPLYEGELWAQDITMWGRDVSILRSRIAGDKSLLSLDQLQAELKLGGTLSGYLNLDLNKNRITTTRFDIVSIDISHIADLIPGEYKDLEPAGRFDAVFERIPSKDDDTAWSFSLSGRQITIASAPVEGVTLSGIWRKHVLEKIETAARIGEGRFSLSGHQTAEAGYAGEVTLQDIDLQILGNVLKFKSPLRGILTADGTISWNDRAPLGSLTVVVRDLGVGDRFLGNGGGEVVIDRSGIRMDHAAFDRLGLQISGKVLFDDRNSYAVECGFKRTDLSALPAAYGLKSFEKGDLLVTGSCRMDGRIGAPGPEHVNAKIQSLEIKRGNDLIVSNKPMEFIYQNGIVELRSFELKYRQGVFGVEGVWDPRGRTAMTLSGRDFSLLALGNLLEIPGWAANGSLSFDGGIVGSYPALRLDSNITIRNLTFKNRVIPEVTGNIGLTPDKLKLAYVTVKLNHMNIGLSGGIPLPGSSSPDSMDLMLDIASAPITDLPVLLPEIFNTASGSIQASMRFTGRPKAPVPSGTLNMTAELLGFRGMQKPFKQVSIGISTSEGVLRLAPLRATMGRGVLEGVGEVDFQSPAGSMTAHLSGQKLDLNWNGIEISGASAAIDLGGTMYRPVVRGSVKIPKGRAQIGEFKMGSDYKMRLPLESLDYKFDIEIPRNFWVKNSFLNAEMRGKFSAFGDLDRFHLSGSIQSVQGWLFFQRRKFLLETGEIKFGEQDEKINPHLYIKSVTNIQNTQIYLTLDGTVSSMTPRLHSSPPLAESDLIALLTLGRSMEEARQSDSKDLFEKEILEGLKNTYLSGLIGTTISTALNLDEVFFGSLFDRNTGISTSFLRVGKYIGRNIFIAYEGTLSNEGEKTYIFEYRLPRGFFINIEVEKPRNQTRIGVKYDWKF